VEDHVVRHEVVHRGGAVDLVEQPVEALDVSCGRAGGGERGGGRLQDAAHLEPFQHRRVLVDVDDE
jgi:hypothetical protein